MSVLLQVSQVTILPAVGSQPGNTDSTSGLGSSVLIKGVFQASSPVAAKAVICVHSAACPSLLRSAIDSPGSGHKICRRRSVSYRPPSAVSRSAVQHQGCDVLAPRLLHRLFHEHIFAGLQQVYGDLTLPVKMPEIATAWISWSFANSRWLV